MNTLVCA